MFIQRNLVGEIEKYLHELIIENFPAAPYIYI